MNYKWQKIKQRCDAHDPQKYKMWTTKTTKQSKLLACKIFSYEWQDKAKNQSVLAELRDDLILAKIANFHKYVGSLVNKIVKCNQIET